MELEAERAFDALHGDLGGIALRLKAAESAIDALTEATVKLREDMTKTNEACLKENLAWSMTDRMVTQMNDLLGMQQTQIRDLVRQCGDLDKQLSRHLEDMGYSE